MAEIPMRTKADITRLIHRIFKEQKDALQEKMKQEQPF